MKIMIKNKKAKTHIYVKKYVLSELTKHKKDNSYSDFISVLLMNYYKKGNK
jgi:hypothetical protein